MSIAEFIQSNIFLPRLKQKGCWCMFRCVPPATRTIRLKPGRSESITLCMLDDFEGSFTIKALDPSTLKSFKDLKLETDYTV